MKRLRSRLLAILFLTAAYVFVWPAANVPYYAAVLLHLLAGIAMVVVLALSLASSCAWRRTRAHPDFHGDSQKRLAAALRARWRVRCGRRPAPFSVGRPAGIHGGQLSERRDSRRTLRDRCRARHDGRVVGANRSVAAREPNPESADRACNHGCRGRRL